jgi:cyclic pyranopterin phosphate synthase
VDDFTHFDAKGRARMVDVEPKEVTSREARARGTVYMAPETLQLIISGGIKKGDVLAVAQVAGIMGAKKTPELVPMCHPLLLTGIDLDFRYDQEQSAVEIEARVSCQGKTGVEMEALTAVSIAALTIYDMCKAVDRAMVIGEIRLVEKSGGKSGRFFREGEKEWGKF